MPTIATTTETFGGGDYRWLQSARGTGHPKSGTLDVATFTEATDFPDGFFPSGLPLSFNSGTGLYEPVAAVDSHLSVAGFLWHDINVEGDSNVTAAMLTDVTIVASFVPGDHDLTDGRYLIDRVDTDPAGV